jgi:hypothetical protein
MRGGRGARRCGLRRGRLHSLGRMRPESTRPHRAQRCARPAAGCWSCVRCDASSVDSSVSRVGSTSELDGKGGVGEARSCVEIVSVTCLRFSALRSRQRVCRTRFEATPFSVRAYARLARRCASRRRSPAHPEQHAPTDAHGPHKTCTCAHPRHRPNRPSTRRRSCSEWLDARRDPPHAPTRQRESTRPPRRPGWLDPGLHLLQVGDLRHRRPTRPRR